MDWGACWRGRPIWELKSFHELSLMGYRCGSLRLVRRCKRPWIHELETLNEGMSACKKGRLDSSTYCVSTIVIRYPPLHSGARPWTQLSCMTAPSKSDWWIDVKNDTQLKAERRFRFLNTWHLILSRGVYKCALLAFVLSTHALIDTFAKQIHVLSCTYGVARPHHSSTSSALC